jgi:hypothetical protein
MGKGAVEVWSTPHQFHLEPKKRTQIFAEQTIKKKP